MLNTFPRRATHVSVQPPLSQMRMGAVAWMMLDAGTPANHVRRLEAARGSTARACVRYTLRCGTVVSWTF